MLNTALTANTANSSDVAAVAASIMQMFTACVTYDDGAILVLAPRTYARYDDALRAVDSVLEDIQRDTGEWINVTQVLSELKQRGGTALDGASSRGVAFSSQDGTSLSGYAHILRVGVAPQEQKNRKRKRRQ